MKKVLVILMGLILALSVFGCGKDEQKDGNDINVQTQSEQTEEPEVANDEQAETAEDTAETNEAPVEDVPVIESSEDLTNIVDEFNSTDDPERKEELRQQLEALFEQAEALSSEVE